MRFTAHHSNPKRIKGWIVFDSHETGNIVAEALTATDAARIADLLNRDSIAVTPELYGLRMFEVVELARDASRQIAWTSDCILAIMFDFGGDKTKRIAKPMLEMAQQLRTLQQLLTELRNRSDAWIKANIP